jgi:hypothetical protein
MNLLRLAYDARVHRSANCGSRVQHRRGDGVRSQRQPAHDIELPVRNEIEHHPSDQRRGRVMKGDPA